MFTASTLRAAMATTAVIVALSTAAIAQEGTPDPTLDALLNETHAIAADAAEKGPRIGAAIEVAQTDAAATTPAPTTVSLPNGASSITESFGDWTVNCTIQNNQKFCAMSQVQGNNQTGQQFFAIELREPADGITNGVLVLPFGLDIQTPVTLKIDDQDLGQGARFNTCLPTGCIVPVAFPTIATDALKRGTTLLVAAKSASSAGEPGEFKVSLTGFTAATNRVEQLAK